MRIGLVAGEASGDQLGAGLIAAVRKRYPDAVFEGVAGPAMIDAGCDAWAPSEDLAVMGLVEPLRHVPRLLKLRSSLAKRWQASPPDVFVGIDAPDFNLALETRLRAARIPTVHYVSPTIWAWRPKRIRKIARAADKVLCILPFEPALYRDAGVEAEFVGHPKADSLSPPQDTAALKRALGLADDRPMIALLPGSRRGEVSRLIDIILGSAKRLADDTPNLQFVIPAATAAIAAMIRDSLADHGMVSRVSVVDGRGVDVMAAADLVILASGTAVLEAALLGKPCIAIYKLAPLSAAIVRAFDLLKLDYVTLPNNLTEQALIPEFLQEAATPDAVATEAAALLADAPRRAEIRDRFVKLRQAMALDADERAADAVVRMIA
ncbi:MAG: lipid-A-disaccharide synthase [Pseudomonadota bacterium]